MRELSHIQNDIWLVTFDHRYDLAMHFLRPQEFYESANPDFREKNFSLLDYMEWYSKDRDSHFSYPTDWSGFNVPGYVLDELYDDCIDAIPDLNKYDKAWVNIIKVIHDRIPRHAAYYVIGTTHKVHLETLMHEVAHGLWYTAPKYKEAQLKNIKGLSETQRRKFGEVLTKLGYPEEVIPDEIQAFCSSGLHEDMLEIISTDQLRRFRDVLKGFYRGPR